MRFVLRTFAAVALLLVSRVAYAQQQATVYVEAASVRASASMDAAVIATLRSGAQVTVREKGETWARITFGKTTGWIRVSTLTFAPGPEAPAAAPVASEPAPASKTAAATGAATKAATTQATKTAATGKAAATTAASTAQGKATTAAAPATTAASTAKGQATAAAAKVPVKAPAPEPKAEAPAPAAKAPAKAAPAATFEPALGGGNPRRTDNTAGNGFSIGVLGSVTPVDQTAGLAALNHIAVTPLILLQSSWVGLYLAPEIGMGANYQSIMLGGGLTIKIFSAGPFQLRALGGATTYSDEPTGSAKGTYTKYTATAASVGGLASVRLFGPVRIGYRGEYVIGVGDYTNTKFQRHSFGVIF